MDTRDGRIYTKGQVLAMHDDDRRYMKEMHIHPTPLQRERGRVGRNEMCPCGSGKKFKRCCIAKAHP